MGGDACGCSGQHSNLSTIGFAIGFVLMMVLDVVMG
jgi:ZIP family zinc transporter